MENTVVIDGVVHELRDDGTIYLGMYTWLRYSGSGRWFRTNHYGRVSLSPGMEYESIQVPEGRKEPNAPLTWMQRLRIMLSYLL